MESSFLLPKIIALISIINGCAMLLNKTETQDVFRQAARNRVLIYIIGTVLVVIGSSVTVLSFGIGLNHLWIVRIFGFVTLFEGILFLVGRHATLEKYLSTMQNNNTYWTIALMYLIIGGFLLF